MVLTRIVRGGAVHVSRAERTFEHAHYAWKIMLGLDAPLWFRCGDVHMSSAEGARALVIPPGLPHEVGAVGWSCTLFGAPGMRNTPWHASQRHWVPAAATTRRLLTLAERVLLEPRLATPDFVGEIFALVFDDFPPPRVDARVKLALRELGDRPDVSLHELSVNQNLSLDRLSHLIKQGTGTTLRKHVVWARLVRLLSTGERPASIAAAAASAGFADHAHLTRTYRSYLGRLPSDFSGPPDVLDRW